MYLLFYKKKFKFSLGAKNLQKVPFVEIFSRFHLAPFKRKRQKFQHKMVCFQQKAAYQRSLPTG